MHEANRTRPTLWLRALYPGQTILTWLIIILLCGWLLGHITRTLLVLGLSSVMAFALAPLISVLSCRMPRSLAIAPGIHAGLRGGVRVAGIDY